MPRYAIRNAKLLNKMSYRDDKKVAVHSNFFLNRLIYRGLPVWLLCCPGQIAAEPAHIASRSRRYSGHIELLKEAGGMRRKFNLR